MVYNLRDMSWSEFAERSKTAKTIIILSGACEVYGRHLPLGSDILVAKTVSYTHLDVYKRQGGYRLPDDGAVYPAGRGGAAGTGASCRSVRPQRYSGGGAQGFGHGAAALPGAGPAPWDPSLRRQSGDGGGGAAS